MIYRPKTTGRYRLSGISVHKCYEKQAKKNVGKHGLIFLCVLILL